MPNVFVAPPGWSWDIVLYFFFGGLAGGCYFLSNVLRLVDPDHDRRISRIGYYLTFPLVNACALLLVKDLGVPGRFWHMILQSEQLPSPMFKWWSPISFGTWIVALSGVLPVISFIHALLESSVIGRERALRFTAPLHDRRSPLGVVFLVIAAALGLLLAGYTGMLLTVTNAPTWSNDPLLPAIFMASGVATGGATIFLIAHIARAGSAADRGRVLRTAALALAFEAIVVVVSALLGIGHASPFYLGWWAGLFWIVVLPIGFVLPLALLLNATLRRRELVPNAAVVGAVLLLAGGLLFRLFEVFGGQAYFKPY